MIKTPDQVYIPNLSQISGPVCPQLFDLDFFYGQSPNVLLMDGCLGRHSRLIAKLNNGDDRFT